ncbi:MAG: hypothetical protein ABI868_23595 [Acidobacteriota bacterium]
MKHRYWSGAAALVTLVAVAGWTIHALESAASAPPPVPPPDAASAVMPQYDKSGALLLPEDYRRWVMIGASLGLSYSEVPAMHDMFAHTLMEPTAYRHYVQNGTFREGTMFARCCKVRATRCCPPAGASSRTRFTASRWR